MCCETPRLLYFEVGRKRRRERWRGGGEDWTQKLRKEVRSAVMREVGESVGDPGKTYGRWDGVAGGDGEQYVLEGCGK